MFISLNFKNYSIFPNPYQSFYSIKIDISQKLSLETDFNLIFNGKIVDDKKTPFDYKIRRNDVLQIQLKNNGGTIAKGFLIFIFVIILLCFVVMLILGILPFVSFVMSNIVVKGLKNGVSLLRSLTDSNNWINSFLYLVEHSIIPFIGFILNYFGMAVITYIITFFSTYYIFYYRFDENSEKAQKYTVYLAAIISLSICGFYFIADIPYMLIGILNLIAPSFFRNFVEKIANALINARDTILGAMGPLGALESKFIEVMQNLFEGANKIKDLDAQLLYNWSRTYQLTKQYPLDEKIKEMKLAEILELINFAELQKQKKMSPTLPMLSSNQAATASFLRWGYDTALYLTLQLIELFDICGPKSKLIGLTQSELDKFVAIKKRLEEAVGEKDFPGNVNKIRNSIGTVNEIIKQLTEVKTKQEAGKLLNINCLTAIISNGALFGIIIFIIFLIFFILFMIPIF